MEIKREITDSMGISGKLVAHKTSPDGPESEAIRVADGADSSAADASTTLADSSIVGRPPQGETGVLDVGANLVQHLNLAGAAWSQPRIPAEDRGVDCEAEGPEGLLQIQVTRPRINWQELARSGVLNSQAPIDAVADEVWLAVRAKALRARPDVILAVDATRSVQHALSIVADRFRELHAANASAAGFKEVWLVGPTPNTTHRLDI